MFPLGEGLPGQEQRDKERLLKEKTGFLNKGPVQAFSCQFVGNGGESLTGIIDTGCTQTCVGKVLFDRFVKESGQRVEMRESGVHFRFGSGREKAAVEAEVEVWFIDKERRVSVQVMSGPETAKLP